MDLSPITRALGSWPAGAGAMHKKLADALRSAAQRGDLASGARMPPERELSRALAVSRTTVVRAYDALRDEGWLESRQGSGTWVRGSTARASPSVRENSLAALRGALAFRGLTEASGDEDERIEFLAAHVPGMDAPVADALAAAARDLARTSHAPGYMPLGLLALRRKIAAHLEKRGLPTREEEVLVTSGAQQALCLASALYLQRGATVVLESPTYLGAIDAFAQAGAHLASVPVGPRGADLELLRATLASTSPRLVYLMPTFQNPTGAVMPERERRELARLLDELDLPTIEDATLADLAFDGPPPRPLSSFARKAPMLYVGSTSKLFWSGLRVGWIRAREDVLQRLARLKIVFDLGSSLPSQAAAVHLLERESEIARARCAELRARYELLASLLAEKLPTWTWTPPEGGLSLWVRIAGEDAQLFAQVALRHGVAVIPGNVHSPDNGNGDSLRLPFVLAPEQLREGVERLARAWSAFLPLARKRGGPFGVLV